MKSTIVKTITYYQKTLSPDHGWLKVRYPYGYCRHYPSCSEYTKQAVIHNGSLKGLSLGVKRVLRCNPFVQPSIDMSYKKESI